MSQKWRITVDGEPFWRPFDDTRQIEDPVLATEVNKAGALTFTIRQNNPFYNAFEKLKSEVAVRWGTTDYFRGRVLNEELGFYNEKRITCESELAYLNDIVVRPFEFPQEGQSATPAAYLGFLLDSYNSEAPANRQFALGNVTVTDPNNYIARSDSEYSTVWTLIREGLLDTLGGYLVVRHATEDGVDVRYLDYLASLTTVNQEIVFGENLLDIMTEKHGEDICTAILPLGAKPEDSEDRITIESLTDDATHPEHVKIGDLVINTNAETVYGSRIIKTRVWDDVTQPSNLLTKAVEELAEASAIKMRTTLTVADLSGAGVTSDNPFRAGVLLRRGKSKPHEETHGFNSQAGNYLLIEACTLPLFRPQDAQVQVGSTVTTLTAEARQNLAEKVRNVYTDMTIGQAQVQATAIAEAQSLISQTADEIRTEVSQTYATTSALGTLQTELQSSIEQTAENITATFTSIIERLPQFTDEEREALVSIIGWIKTGNLGNNKIGVEIGQTTTEGSTTTFSAFCQLVADSLIFYNAHGTDVGTFASDHMEIEAAIVKTWWKMGDYVLEKTSTGGMALRWKP